MRVIGNTRIDNSKRVDCDIRIDYITRRNRRNIVVDNFFEGKVAVVTGAGGVIGSEISRELARFGTKIAILDRDICLGKNVANAIMRDGGKAIAVECNVLDKESLLRARDEVRSGLGKVDLLVNGAGGNHKMATCESEYCEIGKSQGGDFFALTEDGVRHVFDLNFLGTFLPTQVFAEDMIGRVGSSILNISSMNAFTPLTKIPAYSGAKAAISNFTMWLSVHFAKANIRVNAIAPGFFMTKQNESLLRDERGEPTSRAKKILAATPMNRFGEASELLGAVRLLLDGDKASFITGVVLPIDGGFNAYSGV